MNNKFTCAIVDDEQDAVDLLTARLEQLYANVEITGSYTQWEEALQALRTNSPDIIFMDISMPGKNGIDLLKLLPNIRSEIIFTTAHEEYALKAFGFNTSGYVLKPIDDEELVHAISKALARINKPATDNHQAQPVKIGIPDSSGISYVNLSDIQYLESVNGYTKVVLKDQTLMSSFNLGKFKTAITSPQFFQAHRSYIVNIDAIERYQSSGEVVMQNGAVIPVAKSTRAEFLSIFNLVSKNTQG